MTCRASAFSSAVMVSRRVATAGSVGRGVGVVRCSSATRLSCGASQRASSSERGRAAGAIFCMIESAFTSPSAAVIFWRTRAAVTVSASTTSFSGSFMCSYASSSTRWPIVDSTQRRSAIRPSASTLNAKRIAPLTQRRLHTESLSDREFLLRTSLPEEFNADFCEIVLGPFYPRPENWLALMGLILEKNLFVRSLLIIVKNPSNSRIA